MAKWSVTARNDAAGSENKIHDDLVAQHYGFRGGLVPGVTVYAYATRPIVEELGPAWLEQGSVSFRLVGPLYDADTATAAAEGSGARMAVEVTDSSGGVCLSGEASIPSTGAAPLELPAGGALPEHRPDASHESLAVGTVLAPVRRRFSADEHAEFLDFLGDDLELYRRAAIAHPGWLARYCNRVLSENVLLSPWIHVGSTLHHHSALHDGEALDVRGVVTDLYERKGHEFVELDVAMTGDGRPVLSASHTAIWRPRRAAT
jgi:hypothetical protein